MPKFTIDAELQPFLRDLKQAAKRHPTLLREDLPLLLDVIADAPERFPELVGLAAEMRKARVAVRSASLGKSEDTGCSFGFIGKLLSYLWSPSITSRTMPYLLLMRYVVA